MDWFSKKITREVMLGMDWDYYSSRDLRKTTGQYIEIYQKKIGRKYYQLCTDTKNGTIEIMERDGSDGNLLSQLFYGRVKTKYQLKKQLKQLEIWKIK
jgi:hypothetical protein